MLLGTYDPGLVVLSLLVAVFASFTALTLAGRITTATSVGGRWAWRLGGGCAMGLGIWSMHFIGMLAFSLPIPLGYDLALTLLSLGAAIAASIFALWLVTQPTLPQWRLGIGALLMGSGIAAMHYVGMGALRMQPGIDYHAGWVATSLLIAVAASWVALHVAFALREAGTGHGSRLAAACLLGLAIVGMHYTGMAAARFPAGSICGAAGGGVPTTWLASMVVVFTVLILGAVLVAAWMEQRIEAQVLRMRNADLSASLHVAHTELSQAALHDPLTGLPNRRQLEQHIRPALEHAERNGSRFALLFIDLDGLRQVNEAHGHAVGDALLMAVGERLRILLRSGDFLARVGGDEFALLARLEEDELVDTLAGRLLQALAGSPLLPEFSLQVTASVGIALCPDHAAGERQLMSFSEAAMYQAKDAGRNTFMLYADWMNDSAEQQFRLLADLRRALANNELLLHYQPKIRVASQGVAGAEALIRWQHPHYGMVPPERFVRLAERSGVINEIGRWTLDTACRQLRQWHDAGHESWSMAVNLSPLQFSSPHLLDDVRDALQAHRIPARLLVLELTESTLMRDADTSSRMLAALSALGVGISIDDFGTGYSSLLYLKRMPATELKIDQAFVRDLGHSAEDAVIVSAIIALGHALDMDICAEGVETAAQRSYLERLGCDFLQGFLLGRPVEPQRFIQLYGQKRPRVELASGAAVPRG